MAAASQPPLYRVVRHAQSGRYALSRGHQITGAHAKANGPPGIQHAAQVRLNRQRPVPVARGISACHIPMLFGQLAADVRFQQIRHLVHQHTGRRVCRRCKGNIGCTVPAQKALNFGPQRNRHQHQPAAALQMAGNVPLIQQQRRRCLLAGQNAPYAPGLGRRQQIRLAAVQQIIRRRAVFRAGQIPVDFLSAQGGRLFQLHRLSSPPAADPECRRTP